MASIDTRCRSSCLQTFYQAVGFAPGRFHRCAVCCQTSFSMPDLLKPDIAACVPTPGCQARCIMLPSSLHACSNTTGAVRDIYGLYNWTTIDYLSAYTTDYVSCNAAHSPDIGSTALPIQHV
jgi:hypothetical protein